MKTQNYWIYLKYPGKSQFKKVERLEDTTRSKAIATMKLRATGICTSHWQLRRSTKKSDTVFEIKPTTDRRAIELPIGRNLSTIKMLVGKQHVLKSNRQVVRSIFEALKTELPRPLRRGLIKSVIECHEANRKLYRDVMTGKL